MVAAGPDHDVVILNGRVMDPATQFDGVRNVGVKDGRIVTITEQFDAALAKQMARFDGLSR